MFSLSRLLGLLQITPNYSDCPGFPVRITKWSSGLPELFPAREYCWLCRMTPIIPITWITPDYSDVVWINPIHFVLLRIIRITPDHQLRITRVVFPPRLLRITPDYPELPRITPICFDNSDFFGLLGLLWIISYYCGLPRITPDYFELLRITADHAGLPWSTPDYSNLLWLLRFLSDY